LTAPAAEPGHPAAPARAAHPAGASLKGLRALVTGSSSGIGRAILVELAGAGAAVIAHANRSFAEAERLAAEVCRSGGLGAALRADLRRPEECRALAERAFELFGGLDIWVNNAGADILTGPKLELSFEEKLEDLLAVDVRATVLLTRAAGGRMRGAGGGVIINVGWDQAATGMEGESGELFAAAKGAVMSFTKSAALSLAPEVRVNCVAPGWIRTAWGRGASTPWQKRVIDETPLGRWGEPEDVAGTVRWLSSSAARFITGQVILVNGGAVR